MMKKVPLNRREMLLFSSSVIIAAPLIAIASQTDLNLYVVKDPQCGCCTTWVDILKSEGFNITIESRSGDFLRDFKIKNGIPEVMMSCHTAQIGGYFIEGHVPAREIKRLLKEQPIALGLAAPGMPLGSPGMGPGDQREAYDIFVVGKDGKAKVFQHYLKAGISV